MAGEIKHGVFDLLRKESVVKIRMVPNGTRLQLLAEDVVSLDPEEALAVARYLVTWAQECLNKLRGDQ